MMPVGSYLVFYRVLETEVQVGHIRHGARKPFPGWAVVRELGTRTKWGQWAVYSPIQSETGVETWWMSHSMRKSVSKMRGMSRRGKIRSQKCVDGTFRVKTEAKNRWTGHS